VVIEHLWGKIGPCAAACTSQFKIHTFMDTKWSPGQLAVAKQWNGRKVGDYPWHLSGQQNSAIQQNK